LDSGSIYGVKIQATNDIGTSIDSDTQYFACADLPSPPDDPPTMDESTDSSITVSWNAPTDDGGSPVTGYRVYMNDIS